MSEAMCARRGGVWLGGQCVLEGTISVRIFKGSPCQGDFISMSVKAGDPALPTVANIALKNKE
jgi:hypothetical protein